MTPLITHANIVDLHVSVDRGLQGGLMDWPAEIQDKLFAEIEAHEKKEGVKCEVLNSRCALDFDDKPFLHLVLRVTKTQ